MPNVKLSVSNIAWSVVDDIKVASFLKSNNVSYIDIAPTKYFSFESQPADEEILKVKDFWLSYGIKVIGMQSLLFATNGLNIFDTRSHDKLFNHLQKIARVANKLGAKYLVFGSPKNRDSSGLNLFQIKSISEFFFNKLGDIGLQNDVIFCLEPNPEIYNCNFIKSSTEAARFVADLKHPAIKMQLDTGTIITNNEDYNNEIITYKDLVGHIHLSSTLLRPITHDKVRVAHLIETIKQNFINAVITIEMAESPELFESILFAKEYL